ncbi:cell division-like protein, partial [Actinotalea ferrariae]|uniref:FtsK/SpoIIIE domain-containing protein n=1 Tax=Actinotalea ferrariae TaxID=1386098 RepID=UPI001ECD7734
PPHRVALADLVGTPTSADLAARWAARTATPEALTSLAAPVAATDRVVVLDLLADGPHALVAGTTGAGKSELLQAWLLALAVRHPPGELAMVLVDYKGGASFGHCARLPHVVGLVTDLDPGLAGRALAGLRSELARRKRLLAGAGVTDVEDLRAARTAPPRLLVVVDEFRAMAADLPDFVPGLVDLAAQGRSLGLHLVLATQRPAGAVTAQMRANLALRVCLRVTDAADSVDVVEVPDAAALPPDVPGRAVVRRGGRTTVVQTAWAPLGRGAWTPPPGPDGTVTARWVGRPAVPRPGPREVRTPSSRDHAAALTDAVLGAADRLGLSRPAPVWSPPLPDVVPEERLDGSADETDDGLVLGLVDLPDLPGHRPLVWSARGPLVVAGRPGSGRTTTVRTTARAALARGWEVHVVGPAGLDLPPHPGLGTTASADHPAVVARLLHLLLERSAAPAHLAPPPTLLAVDDVGTVQRALERLPRGAGAELLERVLRDGPRRGLRVVVAGAPGDLTRQARHATDRLVLATETHDDVLLGVPSALAPGPRPPGRAVHLGPAEARRCQVALPRTGSVVGGR